MSSFSPFGKNNNNNSAFDSSFRGTQRGIMSKSNGFNGMKKNIYKREKGFITINKIEWLFTITS